jgi:hypothetical protein
MTPDDWRALGEIVGLVGLGLYTAWKARKAEKYAKPTGNGFAKHVMDDLAEIKVELKEQRHQLQHHIQAHADAEVATRLKPRRVLRNVNEL